MLSDGTTESPYMINSTVYTSTKKSLKNVLNLRVATEETVRDHFISQLNDGVIQGLLKEKAIDNTN